MRHMLFAPLVALALALTVPSGAVAQSDPQGVISAQIDAFRADDFAGAFAYAAPGIKRMFRTPENFGRMVQQGYPMVWRPAEVRYGSSTKRGAAVLQQVHITDASGRIYTLEYTMLPDGESWQIAGVSILEAAEIGV